MNNINDKIINDLKLIEQRATEIYSELIDAKEISNLKTLIYNQKFLNVEAELTDILNQVKLNGNRELLVNFAILGINVILLILVIVMALNLLPITLLVVFSGIILDAWAINKIEKDTKTNQNITDKMEKLKNLFSNCSMLVNKFSKKQIEELSTKNDDDAFQIMFANSLILQYINCPFSIDEIPVSYHIWIKNILKMELETQEEDLMKLLEMAREIYSKELNEERTGEVLELKKNNEN